MNKALVRLRGGDAVAVAVAVAIRVASIPGGPRRIGEATAAGASAQLLKAIVVALTPAKSRLPLEAGG